MEEKITTNEEYQNLLKQRKELRDIMYNMRIDIFMNKNNIEKVKLLEDKYKITKSKLSKIVLKLKEYEIENNIEEKKEGKKK